MKASRILFVIFLLVLGTGGFFLMFGSKSEEQKGNFPASEPDPAGRETRKRSEVIQKALKEGRLKLTPAKHFVPYEETKDK